MFGYVLRSSSKLTGRAGNTTDRHQPEGFKVPKAPHTHTPHYRVSHCPAPAAPRRCPSALISSASSPALRTPGFGSHFGSTYPVERSTAGLNQRSSIGAMLVAFSGQKRTTHESLGAGKKSVSPCKSFQTALPPRPLLRGWGRDLWGRGHWCYLRRIFLRGGERAQRDGLGPCLLSGRASLSFNKQ